MRWPIRTGKPLRRRFALFPVKIDDEWTWLEFYYVYSELGPYGATLVTRFHTYDEGIRWINDYDNF